MHVRQHSLNVKSLNEALEFQCSLVEEPGSDDSGSDEALNDKEFK